jgi:hypothetical protein
MVVATFLLNFIHLSHLATFIAHVFLFWFLKEFLR